MENILRFLSSLELAYIAPILYTTFGFFLGLGGTLFLRRLERRTQKEEFIAILRVQLKEALPRLVGMHNILTDLLGKTDRGVYEWLRLKHKRIGGEVESKVNFDNILKLTDEDLAERCLPEGKTKIFQKIYLPVLESYIPSFNLLDPKVQPILLNLRTEINWINSHVERDWFFFQKTFDSFLSDSNRDIILANQQLGYDDISKASRRAADLITDALDVLPPDS